MWLVTIIAALNFIFAFGFFVAAADASSNENPLSGIYFMAGFGFLTMVGIFLVLDQIVIQLKKANKTLSDSAVCLEESNADVSTVKSPEPVPVPIPPDGYVQGMDSPKLATEIRANAARVAARKR